jgi:uncharacterized protein YacL
MLRPIVLARILFVLLATACGFWATYKGSDAADAENMARAIDVSILSFLMATVIVLFEYSLRTVSTKRIFLASLGLVFGLVISTLVYETIPENLIGSPKIARIVCNLLFGYLGMMIALKHAGQISLGDMRFVLASPGAAVPRIMDTSVIIDGRIREMIAAGFVHSGVIVPSFIIRELQVLADSADPIKRARGRRGLTILEALQNDFPNLQVVEKDYPDVPEVDRKLLELARELEAQVVTNDSNLQKVASLYKVSVLNVNELANMLRPAVFVGETFPLSIIRDGKEPNQGVGYLGDGTMVIVDEGHGHLGTEIDVVVTSVLQTNTGRMVFARPLVREDSQAELTRVARH